MKYALIFAAVVLFSCKKEATNHQVAINGLMINENFVTGPVKVAVGQYLSISPIYLQQPADANHQWSLSPNGSELHQEDDKQFKWRPGKARNYTLDIKATTSQGKEVSKQFTFESVPADVRYNLWGSSAKDVQFSENASGSEAQWDQYVYLVKNSEVSNGRLDLVQPGEYITYSFDRHGLESADVLVDLPVAGDPREYLTKYEQLKRRFSEYNYIGADDHWLTPALEQQYKDHPELWGEALVKGHLSRGDKYENERTSIRIFTSRTENNEIDVAIKYSRK